MLIMIKLQSKLRTKLRTKSYHTIKILCLDEQSRVFTDGPGGGVCPPRDSDFEFERVVPSPIVETIETKAQPMWPVQGSPTKARR